MLGLSTKFEHIPESGIVETGKKKEYWYNLYKFTEEQEKEWQDWALIELRKLDPDHAEELMREMDFKYGFVRKYTKKGELF